MEHRFRFKWKSSWFQGTNTSSGGYNSGAIATNPTNTYLEWSTDALRDARDKPGTDDLREGGYYCGTRLTAIKVKNVSLANYRDISNNTNQRAYKIAIWQELLSQTGPTQFISYPSVNGGWTKTFATATRPVDDIDISLNSTFILNDGFDGTGSYQQGGRTNNFKFGSDNLGENPSKNFFGLPILSKTSTNIINYSIGFDNLDATWWPAGGNLLADLQLYIKGTGVASAPDQQDLLIGRVNQRQKLGILLLVLDFQNYLLLLIAVIHIMEHLILMEKPVHHLVGINTVEF